MSDLGRRASAVLGNGGTSNRPIGRAARRRSTLVKNNGGHGGSGLLQQPMQQQPQQPVQQQPQQPVQQQPQQDVLVDLFGATTISPAPQQQPQQQDPMNFFAQQPVQQQAPPQQQQQRGFAQPQQQPQQQANPFADPFAGPSNNPFGDPFAQQPTPTQQSVPTQQPQDDSSSSDSEEDTDQYHQKVEEWKQNHPAKKKKKSRRRSSAQQPGQSARASGGMPALSEGKIVDSKGPSGPGGGHAPTAARRQSVARPMMTVDALRAMKVGTPFLKYGSTGFPHFRHFSISGDNEKIVWFSKKKGLAKTSIRLVDVTDIKMGQTTANFRQHPAPALASSSFSVFYNYGQKTLDVIAKDPNDYVIWSKGLPLLIQMAKEGKLNRDTKQVPIQAPILAGRRTSVSFVDLKLGLSANELAGDAMQPKKFRQDADHRKVFKKLTKLRTALAKHKAKAVKATASLEYGNIAGIIDRCETSLEDVAQWYNEGQYARCDDELWQCEVDFEGLEQMLSVVIKSLR